MWISINQRNVFYEVQGEGEVVLLLHGLATSSFIWRQQIDALSKDFCVYAPDLLGFGYSDKPADFDYTINSYVDSAHDFLRGLGVERVILGVHNLGGPVGLAFAARYPEQVSRLIILDTFAYLPPATQFAWRLQYGFLNRLPLVGRLIHRFVWNLSVNWTDSFVRAGFSNPFRVTEALVAKYREFNRDTRLTDLRVLLANGIDGLTQAVEQSSRSVTVPTLILWGGKDLLFPPAGAARLQQNMPQSVLEYIPDAGHLLQEEAPEEVTRHIVDFIGRTANVEHQVQVLPLERRTARAKPSARAA